MMAARARMLANPEVDSLRQALAQADAPAYASLSTAQQAGVLYAAAMAARGLRDFEAARQWQGRLQARVNQNPAAAYQARLLGAELALATGEAARARELLGASASGPSAQQPRAWVLLRASAWTQGGQAREAAEQLQVWLAGRPRDAQAWQQLSAAYTAQGRTLQAVRAEAEVHAARLDYAAARDRLKAAQELARQGSAVDHIEASIIDTRSRQIESLLREQALER
jgi:predicted Zn-dependent protease